MSRWRAGDQVVLREVWRGRIWTARPATVVEDSAEVIALYLANGSRWKRAFGADGSKKRIPAGDWALGDDIWNNDIVRVSMPGERFSVLPVANEQRTVDHWYINIETPLRRTYLGFDFMDQTLDIMMTPDMSAWRWKDEEELEEGISKGVYSREQARRIRTNGERALEWLLARRPPFDERWEEWRPDPRWERPRIREGWQDTRET